ncbi:MAG: anti-sigma factor [Burkholderiales bacterium RIFCSPHIGHO2_12_FULL_61_11]|nr:MAG: anti-sigma factor [Burkholderiales bacterium RIFCSPHIGHO2_12_FULL_61_11]
MKPLTQTSELISALADGQLDSEDFAAALQACQHDEFAIARWHAYHMIGEVLRSPELGVGGADLAFVGRLKQRLAQEPQLGTQPRSVDLDSAAPANGIAPGELSHHGGPASNDANFRWKLVAGFASLAAVSAIAWNASGLLVPASAPQLAQAPAAQQLVVSPQGPMVRDARLEELLAAHKQLGGTSALQEPSGFFRNATFETPQGAGR